MNYNTYVLGIIENALFLVIAAVVYESVFIEQVRNGNAFLGSFTFFVIELCAIPVLNLLARNYKALTGNLIGILVYFSLLAPLTLIFGAH